MFIIKRFLYILFFFLIISGYAYCVQTQTDFLFQDIPPETSANHFSVQAFMEPENIGYGRTGTVRVIFSIASGYKIYADSAAIIPEDVLGLEFGTVKTPSSITKKDPDGTIERFYQNKAVFELPVKVSPAAKPGTSSFLLNIGFQGCSETKCFFLKKRVFL